MKNNFYSFLLRFTAVIISCLVILPYFQNTESVKAHSALKGIDISEFETVTNWDLVKQNTDFIILRIGTTTRLDNADFRIDKQFEEYYSCAKAAGIPLGAYYYSGAPSREGFLDNAYQIVSILNGRSFDYPVFLDLEQSKPQISLRKDLTKHL